MANSLVNLITKTSGSGGRNLHVPVDGGAHIFEGTLVSQLNSTAMLVPGSTASSGPAVGVATHEQDNSGGSDSDKRCVIHTDRVFEFANAEGGDACSEATPLFSVVYMVDDHTIADNSNSGARQAAGRFMGMTEDGNVKVFVGMANLGDALAAATDVTIDDAGTFTSTGNVEDALQEIYQHILSANACVSVPLTSLREVDSSGDVGDTTANGGVLSSNTTPILRGDANECLEVHWAAANQDGVAFSQSLPVDLDDAADVLIDLFVRTDNTGGGGVEAATFTVLTSWGGGAQVSDTATDGTPATDVHVVTATVAAADVPANPGFVSVQLVPGVHANDPVQLLGVRIRYQRKLLTS